jgi:hypothetical protein
VAAEIVPLPDPKPAMQGSFALFETPEGGLHLVYRVAGSDDEQHVEIPAFMVQMAKNMDGQGPMAMMRAFRKKKDKSGGLD